MGTRGDTGLETTISRESVILIAVCLFLPKRVVLGCPKGD